MTRLAAAALALTIAACGGGDKSDPASDDTGLFTPGGLPAATAGGTGGGGGGGGGVTGDCIDEGFDPIIPTIEPNMEDFDEFPVLSMIPDDPKAVVFVFHGSGGEIGKLTGLHYIRSYNAWLTGGIGYVATESTNRRDGTWDGSTTDPDRNDDMPRLAALRQHMIDTTGLSADTPIFAWGFSNGGGFTEDFASMGLDLGWPIRGIMVHNSSTFRDLPLPAFFTSAENDDITSSTRASFERHRDSGSPAVWHESLEVPWAVEHAMLHPAYDDIEAQEVFDDVVDFGLIAADGSRAVSLDDVDEGLRAWTNNTTIAGPSRLTTLFRVVWATHRPTSEFACEEKDFILEHL